MPAPAINDLTRVPSPLLTTARSDLTEVLESLECAEAALESAFFILEAVGPQPMDVVAVRRGWLRQRDNIRPFLTMVENEIFRRAEAAEGR